MVPDLISDFDDNANPRRVDKLYETQMKADHGGISLPNTVLELQVKVPGIIHQDILLDRKYQVIFSGETFKNHGKITGPGIQSMSRNKYLC